MLVYHLNILIGLQVIRVTEIFKLTNHLSSKESIGNGIPKGLPLGSLLFIIFLINLCTQVNYAMPLLYADNLKLFDTITCKFGVDNTHQDVTNVGKLCLVKKKNLKLILPQQMLAPLTKTTNSIVIQRLTMGKSITETNSTKELVVYFD